MSRFPNPVEGTLRAVAAVLCWLGLIDPERARRTTSLAWPRIITGLARMSKSAVDVAMVGVAVGGTAIAGVGIGSTYWGFAFAVGGGVAAGTIALVSQRYGAEAWRELGLAIRSSVVLAIIGTLPLAAICALWPDQLIALVSSDQAVIEQGGLYLRAVSFGIPFAALNLVGSRALVGADDAYTAMVVRAAGAVANIVLNAILIFGLDLGVIGAGLGTALANVLITATFAVGFVRGHAPLAGEFPVTVDPTGAYFDREMVRNVIEIGTPVIGRSLVWNAAELPMFGILDLFGQQILSAYVIARRIWGLMTTPGWGFGLASSSLVGQALGKQDQEEAERYGYEILTFAVVTYTIPAVLFVVFAEQVVWLFIGEPDDVAIDVAITLVYVIAFASVIRAVGTVASGALDGSGDTTWTFMAQVVGMFGVSIPLVYLGATTQLGLWGLYLAFIAEAGVPAVLNYYRFTTGKWKSIGSGYVPEAPTIGD